MSTGDLKLAIRPAFIGEYFKKLDVRRYYRVNFGPEYFDWGGEGDKTYFTEEAGIQCTNTYLGIT